MAESCCGTTPATDRTYRKILWVCLISNAAMFFVEIAGSYSSLSVALLANGLDFLSDALNYGISLFVLSKSLLAKANASIFKGGSLGLLGLWVAWETLQSALNPALPKPVTMTAISIIGLGVNIVCALLLYRFREGDSNRRSVWICSRNDAIGNIAVMLAAGGVVVASSAWPDILVAAILAGLALHGAWQILQQAFQERKQTA